MHTVLVSTPFDGLLLRKRVRRARGEAESHNHTALHLDGKRGVVGSLRWPKLRGCLGCAGYRDIVLWLMVQADCATQTATAAGLQSLSRLFAPHWERRLVFSCSSP